MIREGCLGARANCKERFEFPTAFLTTPQGPLAPRETFRPSSLFEDIDPVSVYIFSRPFVPRPESSWMTEAEVLRSRFD